MVMARPEVLGTQKTNDVTRDGIIDERYVFVLLDNVSGARNAIDGEEAESIFLWVISLVG